MLKILFNSPKVGKGPYEENLKEAFLLSCEWGFDKVVAFFINNDKFDFSAYFKEGLEIVPKGPSYEATVELLTDALLYMPQCSTS